MRKKVKQIVALLLALLSLSFMMPNGVIRVRAAFSERRNAPDPPGYGYYQFAKPNPYNPFWNGNYATSGNCTWYACGRASEIAGYAMGAIGADAGTWWDRHPNWQTSTPHVGDIICWGGGKYGHVAIVERVNADGTVNLSESAYGGPWFTYQENINPRTYTPGFQGYLHYTNVVVDHEAPKISNVKVTNISADGYTVTCTVTDNVGVTKVAFPTWTHANGQDDLIGEWWNRALGNLSGSTATFRVNVSDHNNEHGHYATHIYAYDAADNVTCVAVQDSDVFLAAPIPGKPSAVTAASYDVGIGDSFTVQWAAVKYATQYHVDIVDNTNTVVDSKFVTGTSATFTIKKAGVYTASVRAGNETGFSSFTDSAKVITVHPDLVVTFRDWDGTEILKQSVKYNGNVSAPKTPVREGHTFKAWDKSLKKIKADTTITATYTINTYTIRFLDKNGSLLDTQTVEYMKSATPPSAPAPEAGFQFAGWSSDAYKDVRENASVTAVYSWANADLPTILTVDSAFRDEDAAGYNVDLSIKNYPDGLTRGKIIVSLKTEGEKMVASGTENFSVKKGETIHRSIYVPYSGVATRVEVNVVGILEESAANDNTAVPLATAVTKVVNVGDDWSDWSETEPPQGENIIVESRTEYRYSTKETRTSSSPHIYKSFLKVDPDWIQYDKKESGWSAWSEWSQTAVTASATRQVETKSQAVSYNMVTICCGNSAGYRCYLPYMQSGYTKRAEPYHETWSAAKLDGATRYSPGSWFSYATNVNGYVIGPGTAYCAFNDGGYLPWYVESTNYGTFYRYRSKTYTYYFYKWGDFSDWQTTPVAANDNTQVETRTVYRYRTNNVQVTEYNYKRYKYQNLSNGQYYYTDNTTYADSMGYPGEWEYKKVYTELNAVETVGSGVTIYNGYGDQSWYRADVNGLGESVTYITYDTLEDTKGVSYTVSGKIGITDKAATLMVYKGTNTDPTASQLEYVAQTVLGNDGSYSFTFKPREELSAATGDYICVLGVEGGTAPIYLKTIAAPKPTYSVEFYNDDGTLLNRQSVIEGMSAVLPQNPSKPGHRFIGWDTGLTNVHDDLIVTAQYEKLTFCVVFVDSLNDDIAVREFAYGDTLIPPVPPYVEGKTFVNWGDLIDENTVVTQTMVVTAQYRDNEYTVRFVDANNRIIQESNVPFGSAVALPSETPIQDQMRFVGWSEDIALASISEDMIVTPVFAYLEQSEVPCPTRQSYYYSEPAAVILTTDSAVDTIYYCVVKGYGVDLDTETLHFTQYTAPFVITEDSQLVTYSTTANKENSEYGVFTYNFSQKAPCQLVWVVDGQVVQSELQEEGARIERMDDPVKAGYTFIGWSPAVPDLMPAEDVVLTAVFQQTATVEYTLSYNANGGSGTPADQRGNGSVALSTIMPIRNGYSFIGWALRADAATAQYAPGAVYNLTADTTLYAVWKESQTPYEPVPSVQIRNFVRFRTERYKTSITFGVQTENMPEGASVHWFINAQDLGTGNSYTVRRPTEEYTVQAKLISGDGTILAASEIETVNVRRDFWSRLIALIRDWIHYPVFIEQ